MVNIRLMGLEEDIKESIKVLEGSFEVISISDPYSNRNSKEVRVYVKVRPLK
ncbi:DUF3970 family protein [Bacillus cereus group sp. LD113LC]|uniref:DUF3970 family protein n=1 Tax=Bacillus cereus group TaxID=86661 RepID=UPI001962B267|nr:MULTISPECIES: DUF3970 family protein [Bacillus cereus group]HDR3647234.1 DUF3970 family protein [Bacillus paranthracis]MCU5562397.1 YvzF family protein [Bacillus pacificus]MDA1625805.1 DUF3970 family protein [Bacillus cereus group sp. TH206-1LC]MDA1753024.1 DUF3970 family protein [Bacillus cereus group sp. LD113LC]MDX5917476.1 DUF3970 family protein [Bacillus cereus group sp. BfR-BA-01026]